MNMKELKAMYDRLVLLGMPELPTVTWDQERSGFYARDGFNVAETPAGPGVPTLGNGWSLMPENEVRSAIRQWVVGWYSWEPYWGAVRRAEAGGYEASRLPSGAAADYGDNPNRRWVGGETMFEAIENELNAIHD